MERPPKLRACGLPGDDQGLSNDFMVNLFAAMTTVAAAVFTFVQVGIAQRDSERAQRESKEGELLRRWGLVWRSSGVPAPATTA